MTKEYKTMIDEIINKIDEDAPANSAGGGNVAGIGVGPAGQPDVHPKRKKDKDIVLGTLKRKVIENNDNNNVMLKGILDVIDRLEVKIDEKTYGKSELKIEEKKEYKSFKEKYNA